MTYFMLIKMKQKPFQNVGFNQHKRVFGTNEKNIKYKSITLVGRVMHFVLMTLSHLSFSGVTKIFLFEKLNVVI